MIKLFLYALIGIGSLTLAYGWTQAGFPLLGLFALILFPLWGFAVKRNMARASMIGFITLAFLSALGVGYKLSFFSALVGILSGLMAWDLDHFSRSLRSAGEEDNRAALEQKHLFQLAVILSLGAGMSYLSLAAQIRIGFNLAVGIALVTIVGIGALVNWLRKKEN